MEKRIAFSLMLLTLLISSNGIAQTLDSVNLMLPVSHTYAIDRLTLSPDQRLVATSSSEGYIKVWDVRSGSLLYTLQSQAAANFDGLKSLCFTPNDRYLLAGWLNVEIWDMKTGKLISTFRSNSGAFIYSQDVSANSKIAISGLGSSVSVWEVPSGNVIRSYAQNSFIRCVKFMPGDSTFLVGCKDSTFRLYFIHSDKAIKEFKKNDGEIEALNISGHNDVIVSGTNRSISFWNVHNSELIKSVPGHPMNDRSLLFDQGDHNLLVAESDQVRKIDLKTYISSELFPNDWKEIYFSNNGQHALCSFIEKQDNHGAMSSRLVDLNSGNVLKNFTNRYNSITEARFSPDNRSLAIVTADQIRLIDLTNINHYKTISASWTASVEFSQDGKFLFYGGYDGMLYRASLPDLTDIRSIRVSGNITAISVARDCNLVAVGTAAGTVSLLSSQSLQKLGEGKAMRDYVLGLEFARDCKQILVYTGNSAEAWDLQNSNRLWYYPKDMPLDKQKFPAVKLSAWYPKAQGLVNFFKLNNKIGRNLISLDGKSVLDFTDHNYLRKGDIATGKLTTTYMQHEGKITSAACSPDGRLIITVSEDHTMKVWDNNSGKLLTTYLAIDSTQWFWITSEGYYCSSRDAAKLVNFKRKDKIFRFEQFDLIRNRPDSVLKKIGYSSDNLVNFYSELVGKRLQRAGIKTDDWSSAFSLPEISILNGSTFPDSTDKADVQVEVLSTDHADSLKVITLWQNGVPKGMVAVSKADQAIGKSSRITFPVKLAYGRNLIEVSATNIHGLESLKEVVEIRFAPRFRKKPELYLIVIGISDYQRYPEAHLDFATKDAKNLAATFSSSPIFAKTHLFQLTDTNVTRDTLLKLGRYLKNATVDDYLVITYSGHGVLDKNLDFYFCTNLTNLDDLKNTSYSFEEIEGLLKNAPPLKKVLLIDACYSGDVDKSAARSTDSLLNTGKGLHIGKAKVIIPGGESKTKQQNSFELAKEIFLDLKRGSGATIISSSSGVEVSYEKDNVAHGLFTYAVLHAIDNASHSKFKTLLLSELMNGVIDTVTDLSKGLQVPTVREQNIEFDYAIW